MTDVTAIILTRNEALNLGDCIKSLQGFAKRVVVVDSGSTDNTRPDHISFSIFSASSGWAA